MAVTDISTVTKAERRKLAQKMQGTAFEPWGRVFGAYEDGAVFDAGDWDAVRLSDMLREDGKARSLEQVLTLPLRGAEWKLEAAEGDAGELKLVQDNLSKRLGKIIDQMTTASAFRKSFFEVTWSVTDGKVVYDQIAWRPPTGCEAGFDPTTGEERGFRQRVPAIAGQFPNSITQVTPGYVTIPTQRAFIYTHGSYRDPIKGVSDLDVALWCWETKRKVMYLWFDFLQNQALPKVAAYGPDIDEAEDRASAIASLGNSGVIGLPYPTNAGEKAFEVIESSGQGANQFFQAVQYLESLMTASVLAAFTDLPSAAASGAGSYALSADQSEFFLASRQAVADEMADSLMQDLFGPLCRYNFGPDTAIPKLTIGPLSNREQQRGLTLLQAIVTAPQTSAPPEFIDDLIVSVAQFVGLDEAKMRDAVEKQAKAKEEQAAQMAALQQKAAEAGQAPGVPNPGQQGQQDGPPDSGKPAPPPKPPAPKPPTLPKPAVALANAVRMADELVLRASNGEDPALVLAELTDTS